MSNELAKTETRIPPLNREGEPRAFFGRKSGKRLYAHQRDLIENLLPGLEIELPETGHLDMSNLFAKPGKEPGKKLIMEIGYGGGEHLARQIAQSPDTNFIGCEVFTGGIGKLLEKINSPEHNNIRLFSHDAIKLLDVLPDASLSEVYLLYPDPWPKKKHHKRRFVSHHSLDALARVLKPGGLFHFATDIEDYATWTLAHILRHAAFCWELAAPGSWHQPYAGWEPTRYEQKARAQGRDKSFYFTYLRR